MKTYRRIEITAFRRRVTVVSGESSDSAQSASEVCINNAGTEETIETESAEGQQILLEAVRLLEEKISRKIDNKNESPALEISEETSILS